MYCNTDSKSSQYQTAEIKAAARGRELDILRDVAQIPDSYLDGRHHACPLPECGGKDRFRLIDADAGAVLCNRCFRENNGDFIAAVCWMRKVSFPEALDMIGEYLGLDIGPCDAPYGVTTGANRITEDIPDQRKETVTAKPADHTAHNPEDLSAYIEQCAARIDETDYLHNRGISDATAKKYAVGYDKERNEIIFPRSKHEITARRINDDGDGKNRYRNSKGEIGHLFGEENYHPETGGPLFLVEGAIDCLSIVEVGGQAMGLSSASNVRLTVERMQALGITSPVLIALDNDDAGQQAAARLQYGLLEAGINAFTVNIVGNHKDPNEYLQADRQGFTAAVEREIETAKNRPAPDETSAKTPAIIAPDMTELPAKEEPSEPFRFIPFPTDALPSGPVRSLAEAYRDSTQNDAAYIVPYLLAGIASIFGCSRRVQMNEGGDWKAPFILYTAVIAPSGSGKSPALKIAKSPFREQQKIYSLLHTSESSGTQNERKPIQRPPMKKCIVSDITVEALGETLYHNPYGVISYQDELAGFFDGLNQYKSKGNDAAKYLSFYNGESDSIDRKTAFSDGSNSRWLSSPALSIAGGIQPGVFKRIANKNPEYWENGFFYRFLWTTPPDIPSTHYPTGIDETVRNDYKCLIDRLFQIRDEAGNDGIFTPEHPQILRLTPEAFEIYKKYYLENEDKRGKRYKGKKIAEFFPKLTENAARIAGVLHVTRYANADHVPYDIDADTLSDALTITHWFTGEAFRLMGGLAVEESESDHENRRVVDYLKRNGATTPETGLTAREIGKSLFPSEGGSDKTETVLQRLRSMGIIGGAVNKNPSGGPATTRYFLTGNDSGQMDTRQNP